MTQPIPTVGRWVHVLMDPSTNNGSDVAPAVITRVWSDTCVNVRVLRDSNVTDWKTSVPLYPTRADAEAKHAELPAAMRPERPAGAFWPALTGGKKA